MFGYLWIGTTFKVSFCSSKRATLKTGQTMSANLLSCEGQCVKRLVSVLSALQLRLRTRKLIHGSSSNPPHPIPLWLSPDDCTDYYFFFTDIWGLPRSVCGRQTDPGTVGDWFRINFETSHSHFSHGTSMGLEQVCVLSSYLRLRHSLKFVKKKKHGDAHQCQKQMCFVLSLCLFSCVT